MSFYCRNTYVYWEYLIPLITVILSRRALPTFGENPHQVVSLKLRKHTTLKSRRVEGGGQKVCFPGRLGYTEDDRIALCFLTKAAPSNGRVRVP